MTEASQAGNESEAKPKLSLKEKIFKEVVEVGAVMLYLFLCFSILETFKCATLLEKVSENDFLAGYATAGISALGLGKFVFILEKMRFTKWFNDRPLIVSVLYKSVTFTILANFIMHAEDRLLHRSATDLSPSGDPTRYFLCFFAHQLAFFVVFFIFFCFREIASIVGEERMRKLFFVSRDA